MKHLIYLLLPLLLLISPAAYSENCLGKTALCPDGTWVHNSDSCALAADGTWYGVCSTNVGMCQGETVLCANGTWHPNADTCGLLHPFFDHSLTIIP